MKNMITYSGIISYSNIFATQNLGRLFHSIIIDLGISYLGWLGVVGDVTTIHIQVQLALPCILGNISIRLQSFLSINF